MGTPVKPKNAKAQGLEMSGELGKVVKHLDDALIALKDAQILAPNKMSGVAIALALDNFYRLNNHVLALWSASRADAGLPEKR